MTIIAGYKVNNSNGSAVQRPSVSVKRVSTGEVVCKMTNIAHSLPFYYIRKYPMSQERKEFVRQLRECDVPFDVIQAILTQPIEKKQK